MTQLAPSFPASAPTSDLGGLLALLDEGPKALPLRHVQVRAQIAGPIVQCRIEQVYVNALDAVLELEHILPLPPDGAVHGFRLIAGESEVRGLCQERQAAKAAYDGAKAQGHRAAILEQEREDVHRIRVANIPPAAEIKVIIELTWALPWEGGGQVFLLPTTIAERYLPGAPTGHSGQGILPDTDRVPDASKLQPPVLLGGGATLDLELRFAGMPTTLEVAQHAVSMALEDGLRVAPSGARLDRDFVLRFSFAQPQQSHALAWSDGQRTLVQIAPPAQAFPAPLGRDASFVVDISGSMRGEKMAAAKLALKTALRGLDVQDRFRIVAFDDRIEPHAQAAFLPVTEKALAEAEAWIQALVPRGGTEMLPALKMGLAPPKEEGRLHTVLFITDGQAWNTQELSAAVFHRRGQARLFTLGIDTAVNQALLQQLARMGGGTCTLCTPQEDIEAKVAELEARFGAPLISDLQAPGSLGRAELFGDQPALLWVDAAPSTLRVEGAGPSGPLAFSLTPTAVPDLGPAFAKAQIRRLEDRLVAFPHEEEALKPAVLKLSLAHSVLSSQTAFVAVDRSMKVVGPQARIVQPSSPAFGGAAATMGRPLPPSAMPQGSGGRPMERARGIMKKSKARPMAAPPEPIARAPMSAPVFDSVAEEAQAPAPQAAAPKRRRAPATGVTSSAEGGVDPVVALVQSQQVDGSWGAMDRTLAAFLALLLLGHTRRSGTRRRAVQKAARFLAGRSEQGARQALAWLDQAEGGGLTPASEMQAWICASPEGRLLQSSLAR